MIGTLAALIAAIGVFVYYWGVARLAADPQAFTAPKKRKAQTGNELGNTTRLTTAWYLARWLRDGGPFFCTHR